MKNKIILTSILAIVATCPALADLYQPDNLDGWIPAGRNNEDCSGDPLTYQGNEYSDGTITYTAQWEPKEQKIKLDNNTANGGDTTPLADPQILYTKYANGVYTDTSRTNAYKMTTTANGLRRNPQGKQITLTLDPNLPSGSGFSYTTSNISGSTGYAASLTGRLPFVGFYDDPTSGTLCIEPSTRVSGYVSLITNDGDTLGQGYEEDKVWYAQYDCWQPESLYSPSLTGYTFGGWYEGSYKVEGAYCIKENATLEAKWTPKTYNVTYNCNGGTGSDSGTATYDAQYLHPNPINCARTNFTLTGWECKTTPGNVAVTLPTTRWQIDSDVICTAVWVRDGINLKWQDTDGSVIAGGTPNMCEIGATAGNSGAINNIYQPSKRGYNFVGWKVTDHQ